MPDLTLPEIKPRRKITGMSAILLPFSADGSVDWANFEAHAVRTADAGLTPAINMDTGYANLIDEPTRTEALQRTEAVLGDRPWIAGAYVGDQPGAAFDMAAYGQQIDQIQKHGGSPIIFQSYGLTSGDVLDSYGQISKACDQFLAFELGQMFAPFGAIYDLDTYAGLMAIDNCKGAKHSSLSRQLEWDRLKLRDEQRPDFMVLTGNDLAIDMVMYGSDYLLGLSTFAPETFAKRDACWEAGDPAFFELNDVLQYLGCLAFRPPVPAYKHNAAQFLKLRGWIETNATHPDSPKRPDSDIEILQHILTDIENR